MSNLASSEWCVIDDKTGIYSEANKAFPSYDYYISNDLIFNLMKITKLNKDSKSNSNACLVGNFVHSTQASPGD